MKELFLLILLLKGSSGMAQIDTGSSIVGCMIQDSTDLLTSPNQFDEAYKIRCDAIVYNITLSMERTINYISTIDKKFTTSDGLFVRHQKMKPKDNLKLHSYQFDTVPLAAHLFYVCV